MKNIRLTLAALFVFSLCLFGGQAHAASFAYDSVVDDAFTGNILKTDTYKCALVTGYTPSQTAHTRWSDVSANEITGTGYTAGGNTVVPTFTKDTTNEGIDLKITSRTRIAAEMGRDIEDVFDELQQEEKLAAKYGQSLAPPPQPLANPNA